MDQYILTLMSTFYNKIFLLCSQIEIRHSGPRVLMTKVWPSRAPPNISSISTHGNFLDLHF
jgi:hypothetical protein